MRIQNIMVLALMVCVLASCGGAPAAATPDQVFATFKAAGLEAESPKHMERADYGPAPYLATGTRFLIPSLGEDAGGRLFVGSDGDLDLLEKHYTALGKSSAWFYSHLYRRPGVLVQISGDLPDDQAAKYEAALKAMK